MHPRTFALAAVLVAMVPCLAAGQPPSNPIPAPIPPSAIHVALVPVASGFASPVQMVLAPGVRDRVYIVDQTGRVLVMRGRAVSPRPLLDISGVLAGLAPNGLNPGYDERGLLSLVFHPGFFNRLSPGYRTLYTLHNVPIARVADFPEPQPSTGGPNCQEVIAEWKVSTANFDLVDTRTYREVLRWDKPQANHNGGTLLFDRGGLLFASLGDGGNGNDVGPGHNPTIGNAQDVTAILGKIIRINPLDPRLTPASAGAVSRNGRYRIPADNPFNFARGNNLKELYAFGFRNPYRMCFDQVSGRLIATDVGQGSIEEVDIVVPGGNYGWRVKEGSFLLNPSTGQVFNDPAPNPRLRNPVVEYDHDEGGAIIGGFIYYGGAIPSLRGKYVFADIAGKVFAADLGTGRIERLAVTSLYIKGIGQDPRNELHVLGSNSPGPNSSGMILAIVPAR